MTPEKRSAGTILRDLVRTGERMQFVRRPFVAAAVVLACVVWMTQAVPQARAARRIGPVVTVARGTDWSLTGWRSTFGVCLAYHAPDPGGSWPVCGFGHPEKGGSNTMGSFVGSLGRKTLIVAAVAPRVARVKVTVTGQHWKSVRLYRPSSRLGTRLRFLRLVLRTGSTTGPPPRWRIVALDRYGKRIGGVRP
jgi:hypothetical protein